MPTSDRAVRDACVLGTHRQCPFQNGEAVRPLSLFLLYLRTGFALPVKGWPHCELMHFRHGLPRHDIAATLSHPTTFDLNPVFKFGLILVAQAQALFPFVCIPKWQAGQNASLAVHARIQHEYVLSLFNA
jgi:hypothetical protein